MNLNKVFLIGRLTVDPQLRTTPGGQSVVTLSLATNRTWTDKNGKKQEDSQFHNVVVWGRQAEIVSQFLKKGSMIFVEGRLQTRTWQDSRGETRRTTEIISERVQLGPRSFGGGFREGASFNDTTASQKFSARQDVSEEATDALPEINVDSDEIKAEDIPF